MIAVFLSSMGNPNALTQQLQEKYTHEIYVQSKGQAKYDVIDWQQNFGGWQPRRKKTWHDSFDFGLTPMDVYKQYDEHRLVLVDHLNQLIKDAMVDSEAYRMLRRLDDKDITFLSDLREKGMVTRDYVTSKKWNDIAKRCSARSLIIPTKKVGKTTQYYDLTDFGIEILRLVEAKETT